MRRESTVGFFSNLGSWMREAKQMSAVLGLPDDDRRIVVYSEDTYSYRPLGGYLERLLLDHGHQIIYVTGDVNDPLFTEAPEGMRVYHIRRTLPSFLPRLRCELFITTMPDLGSLHVDRPKEPTHCLYLFHALVSIHMVYRGDAFDHYDAFFCTGEYMVGELEAHFQQLGRPTPQLHRVGYAKLDRIFRDHQNYTKAYPQRPTIVLAPSWGDNNLLEICGEKIVKKLLDAELRVVVRPHPCFFQPIYPNGTKIVQKLERQFSRHPHFVLEKSIDTEDSFHEADVMICGWSGSALEYAFGTGRPVVFIDVPRKVRNPDWQKLGITPFEEAMRDKIGRILDPNNVGEIHKVVREMLDTQESFEKRIAELRETCVFNFGHSAQVGARLINEWLRSRQA